MEFETITTVTHEQNFYCFGDGSLIIHYHQLPATYGLCGNEVGLLRFALETYTANNYHPELSADKKSTLLNRLGATLLFEFNITKKFLEQQEQNHLAQADDSGRVLEQRLWLLHPYQLNNPNKSVEQNRLSVDENGEIIDYGTPSNQQNMKNTLFKYHANKTVFEWMNDAQINGVKNYTQNAKWFFDRMVEQTRWVYNSIFFNELVATSGRDGSIITLEGPLGRFTINLKGESICNIKHRSQDDLMKQAWVLPVSTKNDDSYTIINTDHTQKNIHDTLKQVFSLPLHRQGSTWSFLRVVDKILVNYVCDDTYDKSRPPHIPVSNTYRFGDIIPVERPIFLNDAYQYFDLSYLLKSRLQENNTKSTKKYSYGTVAENDLIIMRMSQLADSALISVFFNHIHDQEFVKHGKKMSPPEYKQFQRFLSNFNIKSGRLHHYVRFGLGVNTYELGGAQGVFHLDIAKTAVLSGFLKSLLDYDQVIMTGPTPFAVANFYALKDKVCAYILSSSTKSQFTFLKNFVFGDDENIERVVKTPSLDELAPTHQDIKEFLKKDGHIAKYDKLVYFSILSPNSSPPTPLPFIFGDEATTFTQTNEVNYPFLCVSQESIAEMVLALNLRLNEGIQRVLAGAFIIYDIDNESKQALFTWLQIYYRYVYLANLTQDMVGKDSLVVVFKELQPLPKTQDELEHKIRSWSANPNALHDNDFCIMEEYPYLITSDQELFNWVWRILLAHKAMEIPGILERLVKTIAIEDVDKNEDELLTSVEHNNQPEFFIPLLGHVQDISQSPLVKPNDSESAESADTSPSSTAINITTPVMDEASQGLPSKTPSFILEDVEDFDYVDGDEQADIPTGFDMADEDMPPETDDEWPNDLDCVGDRDEDGGVVDVDDQQAGSTTGANLLSVKNPIDVSLDKILSPPSINTTVVNNTNDDQRSGVPNLFDKLAQATPQQSDYDKGSIND